ncbi:MAG TPA: hypothetical protein VJT31_30770 [Rugosimonospora sp.]|nr:hypothetical protein [Rugosimonospora sp.]
MNASAWTKALAWTTATVAAAGLTAWLGWLLFSTPTVTVYTSPSGSRATCHSLAAVAAGKDNGDDAYDAGYLTNGLAATAQAINTACDEKRIGKLVLVGLIAAPTTVIDVGLFAAMRRRRIQGTRDP